MPVSTEETHTHRGFRIDFKGSQGGGQWGPLLQAALQVGLRGPQRWLSRKLSSSGSGCHTESSLPCAGPCSWGQRGPAAAMARSVLPGFLWESTGCLSLHATDARHRAALCFPGCQRGPALNPLRARSTPVGTASDVSGPCPTSLERAHKLHVVETLPSLMGRGLPLAQL